MMADNSLDDLSRGELVQRCLLAEENMKKAATFGNSLLSQLSQERTERKRLQSELAAHEQSNHELRGQLEVKAAMERSAREELEAVQRDLTEAKCDATAVREEGRRLELQLRADLHREMLKAEAAEADAGSSRAAADKAAAAFRAEAEELRQQLECCGQNSVDSLNVSKISGDLAELRDEKAALEQELASSAALQRALKSEVKAARSELEEATEVLRAREEKIVCLKEQLESLQAQNAVLSSELDVARAGGGSRGNSLFSELEDRRVRAERCLVEQQERNRVLEESYRAKVRELREFKEDVCAQMIALRHQRKDDGAAAALCEAEQRCAQLEAQLRERRAEEERQASAQELELRQQEELAAAFGEGGSAGSCDTIVRMHKKKAADLAKALEERVAEVWKLRGDRREAIARAEQLRAELRESETARLRLSVQLEGAREELNLQRCEKKPSGASAPAVRQRAAPEPEARSPEPPKEEEEALEQRLQRLVLKTVNLDLVNQPRADSADLAVRFELPGKEQKVEAKKENVEGKEKTEERKKPSERPRTARQPPKVIREAEQDPECKQM